MIKHWGLHCTVGVLVLLLMPADWCSEWKESKIFNGNQSIDSLHPHVSHLLNTWCLVEFSSWVGTPPWLPVAGHFLGLDMKPFIRASHSRALNGLDLTHASFKENPNSSNHNHLCQLITFKWPFVYLHMFCETYLHLCIFICSTHLLGLNRGWVWIGLMVYLESGSW